MKSRTLWTLALSAGLLAPMASFSQERGGNNRGGGDDRARMQEFRLNMTKEALAPADDAEWQVLKPKLEKVWAAQSNLSAGFRGMFGSRGGDRDRGGDRGGENRAGENRERDRGGDDNRPRGAVEQASRDLRDLLQNKDAPKDQIEPQIAAKLAALREARVKAKAELEAAQKELKELLTPRQEAVLVAAQTLE